MSSIIVRFKNLLFIFLFCTIAIIGKSQTPTYQLRVANESQPNPNTFEFEVFLLNTGSIPFELQTIQFGLGWDTTILNGGTVSYSIVNVLNGDLLQPVPSELNPSQVPVTLPQGGIVYSVSNYPGVHYRYFNCSPRTPPGCGNGTLISTVDGGCGIPGVDLSNPANRAHPGTRIARFRMTNSVPWRENSTCKLIWSTNGGSNKVWTVLQAYPPCPALAINITDINSNINYNNPVSCFVQPYGFILNATGPICISPPTASAGGPYVSCSGSVQLNGSVGGSATTGTWTSPTGGIFLPSNTDLNAVYQPSALDLSNGIVVLTLTSDNPNGDPCLPAESTVNVSFVSVDDENICTQDVCNSQTGEVLHTPIEGTDDGNACTLDACNTSSGIITHEDINIDDNNVCTNDACNSVSGQITHILTINISDDNACTIDICNSVDGSVTHIINYLIDDNNVCTDDFCNSIDGNISHDTIPGISDGNVCTIDACNSVDGTTTHFLIPGINDNNVCTIDACNSIDGSVTHIADPSINDGNPCTADFCNTSTGITHTSYVNITDNDTTICPGMNVELDVENTFPAPQSVCSILSLPLNLRSGLIAFYPFCGNANDISGNGYNGAVSTATLTTDRFGNANSAYNFNGTSSMINITNNFFNNGWTNYTVSVWFNTTTNSNPSGASQAILNTSPHNGFALVYNNLNSARLSHLKNSNPAAATWDIINNDNFNLNPVSLNTWYHVVIVKTGLTYRYYINGIQDKVVTTTLAPISYMCSLRIGGITCCDLEFFKGKIDDIAIFNRSLSLSEIQQLNNYQLLQSYLWSNGSTSSHTTVSPVTSTKYYCTVTQGILSCTDSVSVNVYSTPLFANAGGPYVTCNGSVQLNGSIGGGAISGTWSSSTGGTFNPNANTLNARYNLSAADISNGSVNLTLTSSNPGSGQCASVASMCLVTYNTINDDNACTIDVCNSTTATITHSPIAGIDDGNFCTTDACNTSNGSITHTTISGINDNNLCTTDNCNSTNGNISHLPIPGIDDSNFCTIDACNSSNGVITHTIPSGLDDGNFCTVDVCDSGTGAISHASNIQSNPSAICIGGSTTLSIISQGGVSPQACGINDLPQNLRTGLVAYYPFCGNANDMSGNGNNGTENNVTLTTDRFGNANRAYNFTGTGSSYINISNSFINNGWTNSTISIWFNTSTNSNPTGASQAMLNTNPHNGFALVYNYSNNRKIEFFKNSNPTAATWDILFHDPFTYNPITLNAWTHVVIVKTGLTYTYYVNGAIDKVVTTTLNPITSMCSLRIGGITCCDIELFKGKLDDIAIYNRSLSTTEVQQLFSSESYAWSNGSTASSITVSPTQTTTYSCVITHNGTNCTANKSVNVSAVYNVNNNDSFCQGSNYVLPWGNIVNSAGDYSHTFTSLSGCDSMVTIHLAMKPSPSVSISGPTKICNGVGITLNATNNLTYLWSNGATTQNIIVSTAAIYSVVVTNAFNCTASSGIYQVVADTCPVTLHFRMLIEGFYRTGGFMAATIDPINLPLVCDIVKVELRNPVSPFNLFRTVQGTIGTDGWGTYSFPSAAFGNSYYITLKHRNSIETWSKLPVQFFNLTNYDFTTSSTQAFDDGLGNLPMSKVDGTPDRWAIFSGDINQDGAVNTLDMTLEENNTNAAVYGYEPTDLTGEGASDALDMTIIENNSNRNIFVMRP